MTSRHRRITCLMVVFAGLLLAGCGEMVLPASSPTALQMANPAIDKGPLVGPKLDSLNLTDLSGKTGAGDVPQDSRPATQKDNHTAVNTTATKPPPVRSVQPVQPADTGQVLYYSGSRQEKLVALTFDDGPDAVYTPKILDILKSNGVQATFFLIGSHVPAYPDMVKRIQAEGHAIGNHSWDHPNFATLSPEAVKNEVNKTDQALYAILGYHPAIFRPPYGSTTPAVVNEIGNMHYKVIDWSVDTRDWAGTPAAKILNYVNDEMYPGGIILQHSAGGQKNELNNTVTALPQIIKRLREQGYSFVTVPEMLHIPDKITAD